MLSCNYAAILLGQLQAFKRRWLPKQSSAGARILSDAALKEIANLQVHIEKGCLSGRKKRSACKLAWSMHESKICTLSHTVRCPTGIKPGRGTNRNESLHRSINSIMTTSRYV